MRFLNGFFSIIIALNWINVDIFASEMDPEIPVDFLGIAIDSDSEDESEDFNPDPGASIPLPLKLTETESDILTRLGLLHDKLTPKTRPIAVDADDSEVSVISLPVRPVCEDFWNVDRGFSLVRSSPEVVEILTEINDQVSRHGKLINHKATFERYEIAAKAMLREKLKLTDSQDVHMYYPVIRQKTERNGAIHCDVLGEEYYEQHPFKNPELVEKDIEYFFKKMGLLPNDRRYIRSVNLWTSLIPESGGALNLMGRRNLQTNEPYPVKFTLIGSRRHFDSIRKYRNWGVHVLDPKETLYSVSYVKFGIESCVLFDSSSFHFGENVAGYPRKSVDVRFIVSEPITSLIPPMADHSPSFELGFTKLYEGSELELFANPPTRDRIEAFQKSHSDFLRQFLYALNGHKHYGWKEGEPIPSILDSIVSPEEL